MRQRSRQRHVGQDKLGGRGSDVYRKIQQVYQHGHVDDSPADAQQAGEKADRHAHDDPQGLVIRETMDRARRPRSRCTLGGWADRAAPLPPGLRA